MIYLPASLPTPIQQRRYNLKRKKKPRPSKKNNGTRFLTHAAEEAVSRVADTPAEDTSHGNVRDLHHATTMVLQTDDIAAEMRSGEAMLTMTSHATNASMPFHAGLTLKAFHYYRLAYNQGYKKRH